ncbi:MAG: hypothetical protein MJZ71_09180, partial [Bacteroidales bacterium]|nr:hypothetical protein [Bacteroidales bacterium]
SCIPLLFCSGCGEEVSLLCFEFASMPTRTSYMYGETISTEGLVLNGIFSDGSTRVLIEGKDYIVKTTMDEGASLQLLEGPYSDTLYRLPYSYSFLPFKKITLEGGAESPVDKAIKNIENAMSGLSYQSTINGFDKFFLVYSSTTCEKCEAMDYASYLTGKPFISIYVDEETSETTDNETAFTKHLERNQKFYELVGGKIYDTAYFQKGYVSETDVENLETADPDNFLTPTIMLVDLSSPNPGVSECCFGVRGETTNDKKQFLLDMWNHTGLFE